MARAEDAKRAMGGERSLRLLVERFGLADSTIGPLSRLLNLLAADPRAPTAIRDRCRAIDDHLADSLVALELDEVLDAKTLVDIGSGAGLPGLPVAIARPELAVILLESSARKCGFIARAVAECGISNAQVVNARAEAWPEGLGRFDVATARAVAPLEVVVEYAAPLLAVGGVLVAWRGRREPGAEAAAADGARVIGMEPGRVVPARPFEGVRDRNLHLISKVMATPAGFPRRPGAAQKRPLSELSAPIQGPSDRLRR